MSETILEMKGICKSFGGIKALDHVDFELKQGEIHAIVGENGAGKSTLMNVLLSIVKKDEGTIIFKGKEIDYSSPAEVLRNGISMIHQEVTLIPELDVAENIWLGREEIFTKAALINIRKRYEATRKLLKEIDIDVDVKAKAKELSVAQIQMVELARAISFNPAIIIMDEPTSSLTDKEVEKLYKIVKTQTAKGVSIVFISHKLEEILEICERATILRDGKLVAVRNCNDITRQDLVNAIVGREVKSLYDKGPSNPGEVIFEVKNISSGKEVNDVSFQVRKGEVYGLCGLMGAGRSEILETIYGIRKKTSGEVFLEGKPLKIKIPKDAVRAGIGMVTEDRSRKGLIHMLSVQQNATIAVFYKFVNKLTMYRPRDEGTLFQSIAEKLSIKYADPHNPITSLSGGNQQKVIVSRWILISPKVLLLDEPTRGIDVGSKAEIYKLIDKLADDGMAIVMVSSELPEILSLSDRIGVVYQGKIVYERPREGATQEELMRYAFGEENTDN